MDSIFLQSAQETFANASAIVSPDDPRMKVIDQALWTWILKVLGEIDSLYAILTMVLTIVVLPDLGGPWRTAIPFCR